MQAIQKKSFRHGLGLTPYLKKFKGFEGEGRSLRISQILSGDREGASNMSPETIVLNSPKPIYSGRLTICPTPIGNLDDMTLEAYYKLNQSDIVACEDKTVGHKLFQTLERKKLGEKFRNFFEERLLANDSDYQTERFFQERSDLFGSGIGVESSLIPENLPDHPNLFQVRRNKKQIRELQKAEEDLEKIKKSENLLRDLDSLNFLGSKYDDKEFSGGSYVGGKGADFLNDFDHDKDLEIQAETSYYDSKFAEQQPNQSVYGIDDQFIGNLRVQVQNCKSQMNRPLLTSVNQYNENSKISKLLHALKCGLNVSLISDAGTPCISDPGYRFVNACLKNGIKVEGLIGPSSVELALQMSGFGRESYTFQGFLPKEKNLREQTLTSLRDSGTTVVFFENKNRALKTLRSIEEIYGQDHLVYIGVELTKMFERNLRGRVSDLYDALNQNPDYTQPSFKGELTIVIAPLKKSQSLRKLENSKTSQEIQSDQRAFQKSLVSSRDVLAVLRKNLDLSIPDEVQLLQSILKISKAQAYTISSESSALKSRERLSKKMKVKDTDYYIRKNFTNNQYQL